MQTAVNMRYLMASMGYKSSEVRVDSSLKVVKKQQRITVTYTVDAGRLFRIDSVAYNLADSGLQTLAFIASKDRVLKKGDPFEEATVDQELNRLVGIFQNNGYYKFNREDIFAEVDSGYAELIDPTLDPFEYVQKLSEFQAKRATPEVDIYIRMKNLRDSSHVKAYKIGEFNVYPDVVSDQLLPTKDTTEDHVDRIKVVSMFNTFEPSFIAKQIELKPGLDYTRDRYSRTLNNLNRLGTWQNINIISQSVDSTATLNYLLRMTPAKKQYFSVDLEGSSIINSSQITTVGAGKVGLAVNFSLRNRNLWKKAIQLENSLRTGIEFNDFSKILSGEVTLTNRLTIPWLDLPFKSALEKRIHNAKTIISADFSYIDRFQYYQLRTFNAFLGYEWRPTPATSWQFRPFNFEYTRFRPDSLFKESIKDYPLLLYTYNNGLIIGSNILYSHNFNPAARKHINLIRVYAEVSGLLTGALFKSQTGNGELMGDLYRFIKLDVDFRHVIKFRKSSLHFRTFAGYGYAFNTEYRQDEVTLPFFKSYTTGGPNSMRGWQIRKLGIGSNIFFDTLQNGELNDKYADIQLEANFEYRFNLFQFFGFWMRGAVFTDIGNIWYRNDVNGQLPRADLNFSRFYKDLAVASGFGARVDFGYFLLRFDLGFPLKDPRYGTYNTGDPKAEEFYTPNKYSWFVKDVWNKPTFQFAIGYPF
jgi:outer membrane protein assembly factor BamA